MNKSLIIVSLIVINCLTLKSQTIQVLGDAVDGKNQNVKGKGCPPYYSVEDLRVDNKIDSSLYYKINSPCAIAVIPDTSWINEQQRSMSEDEWNTIVDDHQYYQSLAEETLETNGIKVVYRFNERRYIRFVKRNGRTFTIDRAKKEDIWGLILFNGKDDPVLWHDTDITIVMKEIYSVK